MQNTLTRLQARLEQFKEEREKDDQQIQQQKERYTKLKPSFRQTFDNTILKDIKDFINSLRELFKRNGLVLKLENHKSHDHFKLSDSPLKPYIVVAIESSKKSVRDRWKNCPFLLFESDIISGKVALYSCNESLEYYSHQNYLNLSEKKLVYETKLAEYKIEDIIPFFEDFVDNTLENVEKLEVVQRPEAMRADKRISNLTGEVINWKDKYYQLLEKHNSFLEEKL